MSTERSLIEIAEHLLLHEKKPMEIYDLFDAVIKDLDVTEADKVEMVTKFYTDLTISAKFVYVGDNQWNLKANEKIELWEKDGSFYKEYTVVELPEEYKQDPYAAKPKPKPAKVVEPKVEVVEEVIPEPVQEEPVVEAVEEEVIKTPVVEPVFEETTSPVEFDDESEDEEFEEEVFDDYDDFDEEKYNEYMDTYEDQYDD